VRWDVEYTDQFERWWDRFSEDDQERVQAAVEILESAGPALGAPVGGHARRLRLPNLKEMRPRGGHLRVLFVFDPRRAAILLLGGDKSGRWQAWYAEAIPEAERLYSEHLRTCERKG
jgi:hypothetical protein